MFKKSYLTSLLLIAMLILAACGTSEQDEGTTKDNLSDQDTTEKFENTEKEIVEDDGVEEEDGEQKTDAGTVKEEDEKSNTEQDKEDNNVNNNEADEEEAQPNAERVASDEQDFSIEILPAYTLTSEEPGRDSLFLTEDGNIFMRIETAPFDQESYDYFNENTVSLLESIKADGADIADANVLPRNVNNALGYTVTTNESVVTGFVFEKDGLIVRLTIFDTLDEKHFNNFLQMGETITNK